MNNNLNRLLASTAVLAQKTHNLHWNIKGQEFIAVHKLTDEIYNQLNGFIDEIAEKILMQNEKPLVTLSDYIAHSVVKEISETSFSKKEVIDLLISDLDKYCQLAIAVESTPFVQPLLDEIIMFVDKYRWFLRSSK